MAGRGRIGWRVAGALVGLALLAPVRPAAAAAPTGLVASFELKGDAQQSLALLQDLWLQWLTAINSEEYRRADTVFAQLRSSVALLGFRAVGDLAAAADGLAVEAAGRRQFEKARLALAAAEALDPGRPERFFARARVARHEGQRFRALTQHVRGWASLLGWTVERRLWLANGLLGLLATVLVAGGFFLVLQLATKGAGLVEDVGRVLRRLLPLRAAWGVGLLLLLVPLAMPGGLAWWWLALSILLWGYGSVQERAVLGLWWLALGAAPFLLDQVTARAREEISPPIKALESIRRGRLYGSLFTDVGTLSSSLPDSTAVRHLEGDLHRLLGQWEEARGAYLKVLAAEPTQAGALLNVGAYSFLRGDYGSAVDHFKQATVVAPEAPGAWFNLGQAYSQQYLFGEAKAALEAATALDPTQVNQWIAAGEGVRIQTSSAGLERVAEIRAQLGAARERAAAAAAPLGSVARWAAPIAALVLLSLAVSLHLARRPYGYSEPGVTELLSAGSWQLAVRDLVPGYLAAEVGEGWKAYGELAALSGALLLPLSGRLLERLPLAIDPGRGLAWTIAALVLAGVLVPRLLRFGLRLREEA
jgi:tetratricopeptide (TPR) repeat protein